MRKTDWKQSGTKRLLSRLLLITLLLGLCPATGCGQTPVIGPINEQATIALIRFEAQDDGINGVVYRQINRLDAFLAESQMPVLVVFYSSLAPINSLIIPRLEQMADDLREQLQIIWIDASEEPAAAASFSVEKLPQFTVVVDASLKRSLIGYDTEGATRLQDLLDPYLIAP